MYLRYCLVALYALLPIATLSSFSLPSITFYAILATSLLLACKPRTRTATDAPIIRAAEYHTFFLLCLAPALAICISAIAHRDWPSTEAESAFRFSLALPLMMVALVRIERKTLQWALLGIGVAIVAGLIYTWSLSWPTFVRARTQFIIPVSYGSILMLFVAITIYSFKLKFSQRPRLEIGIKAVLIVCGLIAAQLTQSRTSWLAVPAFIVLGLILFLPRKNILKLLIAGMVCLLLASAVLFSHPGLRTQIDKGLQETRTCVDNPTPIDNSVCIRFQLWRAALYMFEKSPYVGTGDSHLFGETMRNELVDAGIVSKFTSENFGEPHNDMLYRLANFGIFGGIGLLIMYFAPAWIFLRRLWSDSTQEIRTTAAMGAAVCLGFAFFGLTEMVFRNMRIVGLYSMLIALFMVLSHDGRIFFSRKHTAAETA